MQTLFLNDYLLKAVIGSLLCLALAACIIYLCVKTRLGQRLIGGGKTNRTATRDLPLEASPLLQYDNEPPTPVNRGQTPSLHSYWGEFVVLKDRVLPSSRLLSSYYCRFHLSWSKDHNVLVLRVEDVPLYHGFSDIDVVLALRARQTDEQDSLLLAPSAVYDLVPSRVFTYRVERASTLSLELKATLIVGSSGQDVDSQPIGSSVYQISPKTKRGQHMMLISCNNDIPAGLPSSSSVTVSLTYLPTAQRVNFELLGVSWACRDVMHIDKGMDVTVYLWKDGFLVEEAKLSTRRAEKGEMVNTFLFSATQAEMYITDLTLKVEPTSTSHDKSHDSSWAFLHIGAHASHQGIAHWKRVLVNIRQKVVMTHNLYL